MEALSEKKHIFGLDEYESIYQENRIEVIDGTIYDMASPSQLHQEILTEILIEIRDALRKKNSKCKVFPAPFDVKLSDSPLTIVQPDILVVCDSSKLDGKRVNGAPDFVIEIVSQGTASRDYLQKLNLYAAAKVKEYWIINPVERNVITYWMEDGSMIVHAYSFNDKVKVAVCEDFYIDFLNISKAVLGDN